MAHPDDDLPFAEELDEYGNDLEFGEPLEVPPDGLVLERFTLPHSGNPPHPFCEFGFVVARGGKYILGLQFVSGARFVYPHEPFDTVQACVFSMKKYSSASWATSPKGQEYDARRFGPGMYEPYNG